MNTESVTYKYRGIVITYDEFCNSWKFTLRERDRSASSLTLAKETIDKPVKETKPFTKVEAWLIEYSSTPEKLEITGIAEKGYDGKPDAWTKSPNGRRKIATCKLFPSNHLNDKIVAEILLEYGRISEAGKAIDKLKRSLEPLKLEVPE